MTHPRLSIIIPVFNDAQPVERLLHLLARATSLSDDPPEILVVDGGSRDGSAEVATRLGARVLQTEAGRGLQLNAGARAARGEWLWLLHADTRPSAAAVEWMCSHRTIDWGRFDVSFDDDSLRLRLTARMMNGRSRLTGICTGDQGMFLHRRLLALAGGVPEQPLMEDIELSRRLKRLCRPICIPLTLQTSARRWQADGWGRTVWTMWLYRLRYWLGVSAERLAAEYYPARKWSRGNRLINGGEAGE